MLVERRFDMPSRYVTQRLQAILETLWAGHKGSFDLADASIGRERELFINMVLGNIISQPFRIGSGVIVDRHDCLTGQLDIVIEYANTLSFPSIYPHSERLYLAESICAVIEVKSSLPHQWADAVKTAKKIYALTREAGALKPIGFIPPSNSSIRYRLSRVGWYRNHPTKTR